MKSKHRAYRSLIL